MKACVIVAVVAAAVAAVAIASPQRQPVDVRVSDDPPFSSDELNTMSKFFLQNVNINNQGGVVASPDKNVPGGGSYYYHWMRDGALTMHTVLRLQQQLAPLTNATADMLKYVSWVLNNQQEQDPNNIDIRIEPKFELPNGNVFTGSWCRPQNDGPGLRAIALIAFAKQQLAAGNKDYVTTNLWRSDTQMNGGAIKFDLDYVVNHWGDNSCDLWEEVQSTDFFWNRFHHRRALLDGADFAKQMGNTTLSDQYAAAAAKIGSLLDNHYNGNFIMEETNRQKDGAVICALNTGYANDGFYGPTDSKVAGTISAYNDLFSNAYPINGKDTQNGVPGILYGRYDGDVYGGGCPWVLTTAGLAQLYYRGAQEALAKGLPDSEAMGRWRPVLGLDDDAVLTVEDFAGAMISSGDGVLLRIRYHTKGGGFHMPEQLDKNTGYEASAYDLTWSYASVLEAMNSRSSAVSTLTDKPRSATW